MGKLRPFCLAKDNAFKIGPTTFNYLLLIKIITGNK